MSKLASSSRRPVLHFLKRLTQASVVGSAAYAGGIWYATNHPEFEKYVPLSHAVIDFLEEREFQSRVTASIRKSTTEPKPDDFYYKKVNNIQSKSSLPSSAPSSPSPSSSSSSASTSPSTNSQVTSAITPSSRVSALTSRLDEEISEEDRLKASSHQNNATTARSGKDPLAPTRFFDAVSGTVGGGREYLPLVLLPDESDEVINLVAMSLNDLIASINNSVVTEESVLNVTKTLQELAQDKAQVKPRYANAVLVKSQHFNNLYQSYKLLWDEYLDAQGSQNNQQTLPSDKKSVNPVLAEYSHKLSKEVIDTELLLVKLINSKKDMELTEEEKILEHNSDLFYQHQPHHHAYLKDEEEQQPLSYEKTNNEGLDLKNGQSSVSSQLKKEVTQQQAQLDPRYYGAIEPSDISLKLELALTLLVNALQQHSSVPLGPYIQGVREAVDQPYNYYKTYSSSSSSIQQQSSSSSSSSYISQTPTIPKDRETLISEALKSISVPSDVDLKPVLDDILASYDDQHK